MTTTHTPTTPRLGIVQSLVAIGNETGKGLRQAWAERVQIVIELPLFAIAGLLFALLLGRGDEVAATGRLPWQFDPYWTSWFFVGFILYTFIYLQSVKAFWRLLGEIQGGTLEQTYLSPLPVWLHIAVGRLTAAVAETAVVVGALYLVTSLAADLQLSWRADALAPLGFVLAGGAGYTLVVAGVTLAWKRVELLQDMALVVLMFISGAILPLANLPGWVQALAQPVFATHPIEAARLTLVDNQSIPVWGTGGWVWMTTTALGWLALGVLAFRVGNWAAKRNGSLVSY